MYQKTISPQTGILRFIYSSPVFCLFPYAKVGCKSFPRCSDYFIYAIKRYGTINGIRLSLARIAKCR